MGKSHFPIFQFLVALFVAAIAMVFSNPVWFEKIHGLFITESIPLESNANKNSTNVTSNTSKRKKSKSNIPTACPTQFTNCTSCKDLNKNCPYFASMGECFKHPGWMVMNCGFSCKMCHFHDYYVRCQNNEYLNEDHSEPVLTKQRNLNKLFNTILKNYHKNKNTLDSKGNKIIPWKLKTLSSPKKHNKYLPKNTTKVKDGPWVLRFDNFITPQEAKHMIKIAGKFERSTDVGKKDNTGHFEKVVSLSRTSSNSWCQNECWEDSVVQSIVNRISNMLNISANNTETFQILQYKKGEYYKTHHDFIHQQLKMSCGPRILTFFLYLSNVEEGGETSFPRLHFQNKPKLGRAILWPSILNEDPTQMDDRTYHEARPVKKGIKYAANAWFHLGDFQTPNLWSCTG